MNKKTIVIGAIFILFVLAISIFLGQKMAGGKPPAVPTPEPTFAQSAPTGIFPQPEGVKFSFAAAPVIPATLPTYFFVSMSRGTVETVAAKAAPALNLSTTSKTIIRGGSYAKTWSRTNDADLTVSQTGNFISTTYHQIKTTELPGARSAETAAQQFISSLVPPVSGLTVLVSGTDGGPFDGLLVLDTPTPTLYTNYIYSYKIGGYPLATAEFSVFPVSIIVDGGGIIRSASIIPPPASFQQSGALPLLTQEQILESLAAKRGTLLDVHNPQDPEQGAVPDFARFVITDMKTIYAPNSSALLPAFYITGQGTTPQGSVQDATIFLWAFPEGTVGTQ